jgi:hypothetical protein
MATGHKDELSIDRNSQIDPLPTGRMLVYGAPKQPLFLQGGKRTERLAEGTPWMTGIALDTYSNEKKGARTRTPNPNRETKLPNRPNPIKQNSNASLNDVQYALFFSHFFDASQSKCLFPVLIQ